MRIHSVRITNFRSIVDSDWIPLSPDGITAFVGQNESGKTSILEAIHKALSASKPTEDDFRIDASLPSIQLRLQVDSSEVFANLDNVDNDKELTDEYCEVVKEFLTLEKGRVVQATSWVKNKEGVYTPKRSIESEAFSRLLEDAKKKALELDATKLKEPSAPPPTTVVGAVVAVAAVVAEARKPVTKYTSEVFAEYLWRELPLSVLFNEATGRLPNHVDIDVEKAAPIGDGAAAAKNYLDIAGLNLRKLIESDQRARETLLNRANAKVSEDFNSFWSQTIGKSGRLELKCNIHYYSDDNTEKAGKPYIVFWICDGKTQLYPMQRSQGVRWFVSFFLQLKASENRKHHRFFLLDEPGANLHAKAQADVLRLINKLGKDTSTVIYSTHSPQLLEYPKLFRVHAVQRSDDQEDSPTIVIDAHRLGTASSDTLSPILTAMGVDLSHQQVIRHQNNVLLEEMSGYYYLTSFWKLTSTKQEAHFIAATGVNKIEALANMFIGWGLDFIVAMDDDKQGRDAYKSMKKEIFGDDESLASKKLLKLPNCPTIEDVFSNNDFKKYVLNDAKANYDGGNSEYIKKTARSKPVLAFQFALAVDEGRVKWGGLDSSTQKNISAIISALTSRLT